MRKFWVIAFLLLAVIPAIAQETRSTISGTVRDEQGIIPGASVKVLNVGTGVTQQLTTNTSGYFEAPLLIAGTYEVVIEMEGFKTLRRSGITLGSGQQLALQLPMEIGTLAEEITVTGEALLRRLGPDRAVPRTKESSNRANGQGFRERSSIGIHMSSFEQYVTVAVGSAIFAFGLPE